MRNGCISKSSQLVSSFDWTWGSEEIPPINSSEDIIAYAPFGGYHWPNSSPLRKDTLLEPAKVAAGVISGHFLEGHPDAIGTNVKQANISIKIGNRKLSISADNSLGTSCMDITDTEIRLYENRKEVTYEIVSDSYNPSEAAVKKAMVWVLNII